MLIRMGLSLMLACSVLGSVRVVAQQPRMPQPPTTLPAPTELPPLTPLPPPTPAPMPEPMPYVPPPPMPVMPPSFPNGFQQQPPKMAGPDTIIFQHARNKDDILQIQLTRQPRPDEEQEVTFRNDLPGVEIYSRRRSYAEWQEEQRQDAKRSGATRKVFFPDNPVLTRERFQPRHFEPSVSLVTPSYVNHGRLLFEQRNVERYGFELGVLGPPLEIGTYYLDLALVPYRLFSRPFDQVESSAGKYLPGDNVPLTLYPEPFSLTGMAGMAGFYGTLPFALMW